MINNKTKLSEMTIDETLLLLRAIQEPKILHVKNQDFDRAAKLREKEVVVLNHLDTLFESIDFTILTK